MGKCLVTTHPQDKDRRYWIGIDIGGTFADYVIYDTAGQRLLAFKAPAPKSTRAEAVLSGLKSALTRYGISGAQVAFLGHGTTVATNTLLTREAPPAGVITTRGFGDTLVIRRQTRRDTFDYYSDFPPPIVERRNVMEASERMDAFGTVVKPLDDAEVVEILRAFSDRGIASVAVSFLHSYVNPAHERKVGEIAKTHFPGLLVSLSSDLVPEFREYERLSTTVLNAYVRPVVTTYVTRFEEGVRELGVRAPFVIVQSNGGVVSSETAKRLPVALLRSGTAAGVAGAAYVARQSGETQIITLDIGGTSADVSVFERDAPSMVRDWEVDTFPIKWTALDVRSIGAGGGSEAWIDSGGLLKVGPMSAGADPGPACYGRGGQKATVTDAHVVLGRIAPEAVLGESLRIDGARAHAAMKNLGAALGRSTEEAAAGVIDIINAAIAQEIHFICAEKGVNVHEFTLVAYGGAGPLHAAHVAEELQVDKVLIPFWPGLLCALGVLATEPKADFSLTRLISLNAADASQAAAIDGLFQDLEARAQTWLNEQKIPSRKVIRRRSLDMRYRGQNYELAVDLPEGPIDVGDLIERFHQRHEQSYGFRSTRGLVQSVHARLTVTIDVDHPPLYRQRSPKSKMVVKERRPVYMGRDRGFVPCPVYDRDQIPAEISFSGPAVIEQMDTTILVLPGQHARVDRWDNIVLTLGG